MSQSASPPPPIALPVEDARLNVWRKIVYGSGDFTVNTVLSGLNLVYITYFLIQIAGLRPELAGAVQLIGRSVDAFTDPLMGRISDRCRWKAGRRRPFFLLGAIPFGLSFALLWWDVPLGSQLARFVYYTGIYVVISVAMTTLSIPYLALQPEMALGYDARTSLNTFRNAGSVLGVLAAVAIRPTAELLGGGPAGFTLAGVFYGVVMALPWFAIYATTWERPDFQRRQVRMSFFEGARLLARHRNYRQLVGLYLCGRVSMDLVGVMLILYFTYWIGRTRDFELTMTLFLLTVLLALPVWLRISRNTDKVNIFITGSLWWVGAQLMILVAQPDWPRWMLLAFAPLAAIGYAVVDLIPWAMLGEVVDEDDLAHGERREGLYNGFFTFLRKLAGTIAVQLALLVLGLLGYKQGAVQNEATLTAIRLLTSIGPAVFLLIGVWIAWGYPLTRAEHGRIVSALAARDAP